MTDYNHLALLWAEQHGVIEYHVSKNLMIFYTSWPMEHATYKAIVNLDTGKETRFDMRNYYPAYKSKIAGRYQANYLV